jgi:hypothetical protein
VSGLLDGSGAPIIPPAPPKDERLQPQPALAEALRNIANAAEQGYLVAFAAAGVILNPDPSGPTAKPSMLCDNRTYRQELVGTLAFLTHALNDTEHRERMQSIAKPLPSPANVH